MELRTLSRKNVCALSFLCFAAFFLSSCGTHRLAVGSHKFRFDPPVQVFLYGGSQDGDVNLMNSAWVLLVREGQLYLNDEAYGTVRPDALIALCDGAVFVDGHEREARALNSEDHQRLNLVQERKDTIDNLELTFRPGPQGIGSTNVEGAFSNSVGRTFAYTTTPITIDRRGRLWVRGVLHEAPAGAGTISSAKTLVIEGKKVVVDGAEWRPVNNSRFQIR